MKKTMFFLTTSLFTVMLCSCKANWFGTTVDVPWYFIAVPFLLILFISYVILMNRTYICPECKAEFKPKWYQLSVGIHFCGKRIVKCPKCSKKGFCERKK